MRTACVVVECALADASAPIFGYDDPKTIVSPVVVDFLLRFVADGNVLFDGQMFEEDSLPRELTRMIQSIIVALPTDRPVDFQTLDACA